MQQPRTPVHSTAILARNQPRLDESLRTLEVGEHFTIHGSACLKFKVGSCTCDRLVSHPLVRAD